MALQQVFYNTPGAGESNKWYWVKDVSGAASNQYLELDSLGADYHWRAVMSSNSWNDDNHSSPGFGYLNLLAVAFNGSHSSASECIIGDRPYDLTGARWSCELRANSLRIGQNCRIIFWIQFRDSTANNAAGRYVNIGYIAKPIDVLLGYTSAFERTGTETKTSSFVPFEVIFDPAKPWEWLLYGSNATKANIYGKPNDLHQVFKFWDWDLGFHAIYDSSPASGDKPYGHFNIRKLKLEVDDSLNDLS